MGLFSFLSSSRRGLDTGGTTFDFDLGRFRVGQTSIGHHPSEHDHFSDELKESAIFEDEKTGVELGTRDGVLDYAFLNMEHFRGRILFNGGSLNLGAESSEDDVKKVFGEPYWTDRSDGELILFYEYSGGTLELQFEFPDSTNLGFITLSRSGILSEEVQRKRYGVNKPWPPR